MKAPDLVGRLFFSTVSTGRAKRGGCGGMRVVPSVYMKKLLTAPRTAVSALAGAAAALFAPLAAYAHEVYVLTPAEIAKDTASPPFSSLQVILQDTHRFAFWTMIAVGTVLGVFAISVSRRVEDFFNPLFTKLRPYAPAVSRVTVGVAFLAAAYYSSAYGPELPLAANWGAYAGAVRIVMVLIGLCITFGFFTRLAALVGLALFAANVYFHGWYMLTYTNYLGEIIVLLLIGAHKLGIERGGAARGWLGALAGKLAPMSMAILRVCFGISLLYASVYAKFLHNMLALDVASGTGLLSTIAPHALTVAQALGFEPHFLVLGAGIVEIVIALFFILGIEIRFTSLFLEVWLALSLWYFGEVVWPHLILIGIPIAFIFYGYDKYSVEGWLFKNARRQPVL
jgi:uncharacterized membrane protein YphA (DoxX/SURF4 family)